MADPKQLGRLFAMAQVGMEMVLPVAAGAAVDFTLNWKPWGMVTGAALGFVLGIVHLIVLSKRNGDADDKPSGNTP